MGTCVEKCRQICVSLSTLLGDSSGGNEGRLWGRVTDPEQSRPFDFDKNRLRDDATLWSDVAQTSAI
jgi:hypothetical protein